MKKYLFLAVLLQLLGFSLHAQLSQDKWWEKLHKWDGITPWESYMQLSAKYMGPNGLPVPEINKGCLSEYSYLELGGAIHNGVGDNTENGFFNVMYKAGERAAFNVYMVPYEEYDMDTFTSRHVRNTRDYDGSGHSVGDVYLTAFFQALKENHTLPDVLLSFGIRTASGNNLEAARFIDAPGFYFGISTGKTIKFKSDFFKSVRPYFLIGDYIWQTYHLHNKQDEGLWYGCGISFNTHYFIIDDNVSGYTGYFRNGDMPKVNKISFTTSFDAFINVRILYQYGIRDYDYRSTMFSTIIDLNRVISHRSKQINS